MIAAGSYLLIKLFNFQKLPLTAEWNEYTAREPIVCTSVIIELKDNYLLQSRSMITA